MACHTPPLKKVKKQGEMLLPSLGPIPLKHLGWDGTAAGTMRYTLTQLVQSWEGKQSEEDTSHTCFILDQPN